MKKKKTLKPALQILKDIGIKFESNHEQTKVYRITLPLTAEQWADVVNKDGESLPSCCAQISEMRDILIDSMRDDGEIRGREFNRFAYLAETHGGWERCFNDLKFDLTNPIDIILDVWFKVKDHIDLNDYDLTLDPNRIQDAISVVVDSCRHLEWDQIACNAGTRHDRTCRTRTLLNLIPALQTIQKEIKTLDQGPVVGFGLCDKKTGNLLETAAGGYSIALNQKEADDVSKYYHRDKEEIVFRPVRISVENGIEFLKKYTPPEPPPLEKVENFLREKITEAMEEAKTMLPAELDWYLQINFHGWAAKIDRKSALTVKVTENEQERRF